MNEFIQELRANISKLLGIIKKNKAKHLNTTGIKEEMRLVVQNYFQRLRSAIIAKGGIDADLVNVDKTMQDLLRCIQGRTLTDVYLRILREMNTAVNEIELKNTAPISIKNMTGDSRDSKILEILTKVNRTSALSYKQAVLDLQDKSRISWQGTAVEFRESLRELLNTMAPDKNVEAQPGFRLELNTTKPTMKQKVVFILKARGLVKTQLDSVVDNVNIIEALVGQFIRSVYDRSSVATHMPQSIEEVKRIKEYIALALIELLEIKT